MTRRFAPLAVMGCVALLALVGCRDRSTEQDKNDMLCTELSEVDGTVSRLAAAEPNAAGVAQVRLLRTQIEAQWRDVEEASRDAGGVNIQPVQQAYNNVLTSIRGVNDEASLREAEPRIDQAAGEFSTARLDLHTTARC